MGNQTKGHSYSLHFLLWTLSLSLPGAFNSPQAQPSPAGSVQQWQCHQCHLTLQPPRAPGSSTAPSFFNLSEKKDNKWTESASSNGNDFVTPGYDRIGAGSSASPLSHPALGAAHFLGYAWVGPSSIWHSSTHRHYRAFSISAEPPFGEDLQPASEWCLAETWHPKSGHKSPAI